ncbi:MAG: DUF2384 domain-containing protein [Candidatus Eremiobacteraeota bacterium]|nr:DUF2384 domain-containing protein [Candidatus Eremiobacteraeota bacterium]
MSSLLDHVFVDAHDPGTGKVTAEGLRRVFSLSTAEIAGLAGVTPRAIRQTASSARIQARLGRFVDLMVRTKRLLEGDVALVRIWLRAPHPELAMRSPLSLLVRGEFDPVERIVRAAESANR